MSFLSSFETLPKKLPNAVGIRATNTLNGRGTLPHWRREYQYMIFMTTLLGFWTGSRNEV